MNDLVTIFKIMPGPSGLMMGIYFRLGIGVVVLAVGILLVTSYLKRRKENENKPRLFKIIFINFWAIVWLVITAFWFFHAYREHRILLSEYKNNLYKIAEGKVKVLRKQPRSGHAPGDLVEVGKTKFDIDYFSSTEAYHQTIAYGGQLRDGVYAKVYYVGNNILRIDLKDNSDGLSRSKPQDYGHSSAGGSADESNVTSPLLLDAGVLLIVLGNVIWYRTKLILKQKGCHVGWLSNHFSDYPNLVKAIESETDKVEIRKLIFQRKLMLLLWVILPVGAILIFAGTK